MKPIEVVQLVMVTLQSVATLALVSLTWCYVKHTRKLVEESQRMRETQRDLQERELNSQRELQEWQFKHDLYDKRLRLFLYTMGFLADFGKDVQVNFAQTTELLSNTRESDFLFQGDVSGFINEVYEKSNDWHLTNERLKVQGHPESEKELKAHFSEIERWILIDAWKKAKQKFTPYLKLVVAGSSV